MIYIYNIISISLVAILSKIYTIYTKKQTSILFQFSLIQMTLIVGLRYGIGRDYRAYERVFEVIGREITLKNYWQNMSYMEPGYVLLNKLCYSFNLGFTGLNIVIAFITFYFALMAFRKLSNHIFLSIYLYISFFFFCQAMNQTRQIMAISLALYAISELVEEKRKRFWIYLLVAISIHTSIIVLAPLYWLRKIRLRKGVIGFYIAMPVAIISGYAIFLKLISFTKYAGYFNSQFDIQGLQSTILNLVVRVIMLIICMIIHKYVKSDECSNIFYHMIWICVVCQILAVYSSLWGRITTNFFIAFVILIPKLIDTIKDKKFGAAGYLVCLVMASFYHIVYFSYMAGAAGVFTYQSIVSF